jgi:carbon-monoxide dehydrogenase iron sulfur subunit
MKVKTSMIEIDLAKCTGCRRCETVCAFSHTGKVGTRIARIKVVHIYGTGIDGPVTCVQCREKYCMECPVGALSLGPEGQILFSPTVCTGCGTCERKCPIGAIEIFEGVVYVCDLCGGTPCCVEACTEQAMRYSAKCESPSLRRFVDQGAETPSEKRYYYIETQGASIREKWRNRHG